jgi:hypothetical protein
LFLRGLQLSALLSDASPLTAILATALQALGVLDGAMVDIVANKLLAAGMHDRNPSRIRAFWSARLRPVSILCFACLLVRCDAARVGRALFFCVRSLF